MGRIIAGIAKEVKSALPAAVFFLFLFHLVALTRAVVLGETGMGMLRAVSATVGALIVAKAVLVAKVVPIPPSVRKRGILRILYNTFLFGLVVLLFKALEEFIPLISKHGSIESAAGVMVQEISWPLFTVVSLWIAGGLLIYNAIAELVSGIGKDEALEVFFGKQPK